MGGVETSRMISRSAEFRAVADFLLSAERQPTGLVIEGEAGIGKTTLWLAAVDQARERGFRVFSARGGQAESVLAYAAVADLIGNVDPAVLAELSDVQRIAVDRVLLRAGGEGPPTDQRVVAAAFAAVVDRLSADAPVLVAIDDVQWLDPSSQAVVGVRGPAAQRPSRDAAHRAMRSERGKRRRGCIWPGPKASSEFGWGPLVLVDSTR